MSHRDLLVIDDDGEITTNRAYYAQPPPIAGWDAEAPENPPWADGLTPDPNTYMESELFVAGAISTMPPFDHYHPAWALPFARRALEALSVWEPSDG